MSGNGEFIRLLAAWALVHETADEGWKAAVERGGGQVPGEMAESSDAFVDGLSALVAEEKERLKARLAAGDTVIDDAAILYRDSGDGLAGRLDEIAFELSELRGRIESLQTSVDALADGSDG